MIWTEDKIDELTKLVTGEGLTCPVVAARMEIGQRVVRSKVNKLGLKFQRSHNKPPQPSASARAAHAAITGPDPAKAPPPTVTPIEPIGRAGIRMWDECFTATSCAFPTREDDQGHWFCGQPRVEGRPYCPRHSLKIYKTDKPKTRCVAPLMKKPRAERELDGLPRRLDQILAA